MLLQQGNNEEVIDQAQDAQVMQLLELLLGWPIKAKMLLTTISHALSEEAEGETILKTAH